MRAWLAEASYFITEHVAFSGMVLVRTYAECQRAVNEWGAIGAPLGRRGVQVLACGALWSPVTPLDDHYEADLVEHERGDEPYLEGLICQIFRDLVCHGI